MAILPTTLKIIADTVHSLRGLNPWEGCPRAEVFIFTSSLYLSSVVMIPIKMKYATKSVFTELLISHPHK